MSLKKRWRELDKRTVASAPDRYGVYELGDGSGNSLGMAVGVLRNDLKEELAYGDARQVRWTVAQSRDHAERLLEEHS
ncbi:Uncharacterized protein AArcCO_0974 [Halalkaliarchaeum sp. AArc-CO]|uniref:DUF7508 domain-containing protein n=1 Tax=unclassified Halalkaliarchaeum TaxID=2678344 RepID=UPI00217DBA5F|nr:MULTISPECIES: hypothetical protein [unclassified Halalkaliarchaeum]MDR5672948.1 hypothetical protein [Halalkaliarchaeum sp. AArc-GB]UWG50291.1 Uncharacterized protein AArcCO_0974 [Halalkaliarchaeum sp. AArc-CO]